MPACPFGVCLFAMAPTITISTLPSRASAAPLPPRPRTTPHGPRPSASRCAGAYNMTAAATRGRQTHRALGSSSSSAISSARPPRALGRMQGSISALLPPAATKRIWGGGVNPHAPATPPPPPDSPLPHTAYLLRLEDRRQRERDPSGRRLGRVADPGDPRARLGQQRVAGKQGRCVPIWAHSEQDHVKIPCVLRTARVGGMECPGRNEGGTFPSRAFATRASYSSAHSRGSRVPSIAIAPSSGRPYWCGRAGCGMRRRGRGGGWSTHFGEQRLPAGVQVAVLVVQRHHTLVHKHNAPLGQRVRARPACLQASSKDPGQGAAAQCDPELTSLSDRLLCRFTYDCGDRLSQPFRISGHDEPAGRATRG